MNYGKFFRLNKHLSRIGDGFAIYDYIDLPAYFTPSKDNLMSPKYPISVIIMGDSVVFKLHYSAYKIEKVSKQDAQDESIKGYSNYPQYIYNIEAPSLISENKVKGGDTTKIVHMEEIILELPFTDTVGRSLSDTIRDIYDTQFPLIQRDNGKDSDLSSKEKSSGGRYLEKLIRTRYLEEKVDEVKDVNSHFYESLRKISDGTASYSTLWLMGLVKGDKNGVRYRRTDKKGNVVGFLRKLLLDFMFDLKHSDVFQNSSNYLQMYSGLMSNFYFSALMHKCEYYYYRRLTRQAIDTIENEDVDDKERKKTIATLYASELVKAEDIWVQDIMNPQAEKDFEHRYPGKHIFIREIVEYYSFKQWPSWFAEPEEEMRRVCFTMKDESDVRHICNADTLIQYLDLKPNNEDRAVKKILELRNDDKEQVSRWFLKHYAFSDVLHLHFFKHANLLFILLFAIPILFSWFMRIKLFDIYKFWGIIILVVIPIIVSLVRCIYKYDVCKSCGLHSLCGIFNVCSSNPTGSAIVNMRRSIIRKRALWIIGIISFISIFVSVGLCQEVNSRINLLSQEQKNLVSLILLVILLIAVLILSRYRSVISSLHLFLPRLVASITLAWITLSMGFDLYVSFFDAEPKFPYIIGICVVVLFFVMYSINIVIPHSTPLRKFLRALNLMVVSYLISLAVGFVVINFLGEKFLERSGYMNDFYTENIGVVGKDKKVLYNKNQQTTDLHVIDTLKTCSDKIDFLLGKTEKDTSEFYKNQVCNLEYIYHADMIDGKPVINSNYPLVEGIRFFGKDIFIMRDFLIMFSFIAMFIGIFIQLIIFGDNKQMTEL